VQGVGPKSAAEGTSELFFSLYQILWYKINPENPLISRDKCYPFIHKTTGGNAGAKSFVVQNSLFV
jgi:hypothetical protein